MKLAYILLQIFGKEKSKDIWEKCFEPDMLIEKPILKLNIFRFDDWLSHNYLEYLNNSHKLSMKDFLKTITTPEQLEELEKYLI